MTRGGAPSPPPASRATDQPVGVNPNGVVCARVLTRLSASLHSTPPPRDASCPQKQTAQGVRMPTLDETGSKLGKGRRGAEADTAPARRARRDGQQWGGQASAQAFQALLGRQPSGIPLLPPQTPARHVPRPRLLRRLRSSEDAPLLVLAAPAGYGKSALLSEWVQSEPRPAAWLTLTALDNDPGLLLERLAEALV